MIIHTNKCGQLGNRLFAAAHLIAFAEEHGLSVMNLAFEEYSKYFTATNNDFLRRYPVVTTMIRTQKVGRFLFLFIKAITKTLRLFRWDKSLLHAIITADLPEYQFSESRFFDLKNKDFLPMALSKPFVLLYGRFFRDYESLAKHADLVRAYFTPVGQLREIINRTVSTARKGADILVGVHIRRGDYREFVAGRYFYSQKQYADLLRTLIGNHRDVFFKFLICSNEEIEKEQFAGLDFSLGPGHVVGDMYALAGCDLILGPPSTYTLWASFYGRKPLYQIRDIAKCLVLDDFTILPKEDLYNFSFN